MIRLQFLPILASLVMAQGAFAQAKSSDIEPAAMAALEKMGAYLRTLKSFEIQSETSRDYVLDNGQKITFAGTANIVASRPNKLRVDVDNDEHNRTYFYDGKAFTVLARRLNYYATVPISGTLVELDDRLVDKYDIELPPADMFWWGTDRSRAKAIKAAVDVGPASVEGTTCEQYAFRQDGVDWQVWIQQGEFPLPGKLVITTTTDEARPQAMSVLTWNLAPSFNDAAFTFAPPSDAKKIVLKEAAASSGTKK